MRAPIVYTGLPSGRDSPQAPRAAPPGEPKRREWKQLEVGQARPGESRPRKAPRPKAAIDPREHEQVLRALQTTLGPQWMLAYAGSATPRDEQAERQHS